MLHPNPLIAFKRLARLYGGIALAIVCVQLLDVSIWFLAGCYSGMALMLTVIIPVYRESMRSLDEAERQAVEKERQSLSR